MTTAHRHDRTHAHAATADHAPPGHEWEFLEIALRELLIEKRVLTAAAIQARIDAVEGATPIQGSRVVARAWVDPAYKARLLADGNAAVAELGYGFDGPKLVALENTPARHHMVVCTLCSCYPKPLLGLSPAWYKSREYRSRAVSEPRAVLAEFGTVLPEDVELRVVDSTADCRYLIIPLRPVGTEGWTETRLVDLVTRDSMIGVAPARTPQTDHGTDV